MKIKHSYEPSVDFFSQFEKKAFCPEVNNWSNLASYFGKITKSTASGNKKYITKIYSYSFDKIFSFFKQWRGCLTKSNLVWKERHQRCCSATFLLLLNRMLAGNWCQPPLRHKLCPSLFWRVTVMYVQTLTIVTPCHSYIVPSEVAHSNGKGSFQLPAFVGVLGHFEKG